MDSAGCLNGSVGCLEDHFALDIQLKDNFERGMFLSLSQTLESIHYPFLHLLLNNLKLLNNAGDQKMFFDIEAKLIELHNAFFDIYCPEEENNKEKAETNAHLFVIQRLKVFLFEIEKLQATIMDMHSKFIFRYILLKKQNKNYEKTFNSQGPENKQEKNDSETTSEMLDLTPVEKMCLTFTKALNIGTPEQKKSTTISTLFDRHNSSSSEVVTYSKRQTVLATKSQPNNHTKHILNTSPELKTEYYDLANESNSESEEEQQSIESLLIELRM